MKNIIFLLALLISISSCKKHHEDPISKEANMHIEYTAIQPTFSGVGFQSKVQILFSNHSPIEFYSQLDKNNSISVDVSIKGNQSVTVNGFVIDSTGCGSSQSNVPVTMKVQYNDKTISDKSAAGRCIGSIEYKGTLDFIY